MGMLSKSHNNTFNNNVSKHNKTKYIPEI